MRNFSRCIFPALLTLVAVGLVLPRPAEVQTLRFTRLTTEDGLSHDTVRCVLQDDQGFLWLGTQNGLNRYDGYTFTVFRHRYADPTSLSDNTVSALYEDSAGQLWVGTVLGLDGLDRATRQFHHHPAFSDAVSVILEDNAGHLWIGTHGGGLLRLDRATGEAVRYRHDPAAPATLSDDNVTAILQDGEGLPWVGTWNGLNALDPTTGQVTRYYAQPDDPNCLSHNWVTAIVAEHRGAPSAGDGAVLWVGTGVDDQPEVGGLNRLEVATGRFTRYLYDAADPHSLGHNQVTALCQDRDGALWVGTEAGLDHWDGDNHRFVHYAHDPLNLHSLGRGRVSAIHQDRSGILWFATRDGGVSAYATAKDRFPRFQPDPLDANSLSGPSVGALFLDHDGILWIGVRGGGLNRLDRVSGRYTHYLHDPGDPNGLGADTVTALLEDHEGVLWVGTSAGLDRLVLSEAQGRKAPPRSSPTTGTIRPIRTAFARDRSRSSRRMVAVCCGSALRNRERSAVSLAPTSRSTVINTTRLTRPAGRTPMG
jgi:ligand-binding sensor domain-containing protein